MGLGFGTEGWPHGLRYLGLRVGLMVLGFGIEGAGGEGTDVEGGMGTMLGGRDQPTTESLKTCWKMIGKGHKV